MKSISPRPSRRGDANASHAAHSSLIASLATLLALLVGTPAAYALARFRFELVANRDITIFFFAERVLPPVVVELSSINRSGREDSDHISGEAAATTTSAPT